MQALPDKPQVGLVTDVGRIDDGTFIQYAYEGLKRCEQERGIAFDLIQTEDDRAGPQVHRHRGISHGTGGGAAGEAAP